MKSLDQIIAKIREVALDLREPQDGALLEHQAQKLDAAIEALERLRTQPHDGASTQVHGGGTGKD